MATRTQVYNSITGVCDVHAELDLEQILDIILAKGKYTGGNKFDAYVNITAEWGVKEWQGVLKEFYSSYEKANLCKLSFEEMNPGTEYTPMIEAQKQITQYQRAPDNYYLHMICDELERPTEGTPVSDVDAILVSVYVAISSGENYGSVGNPPKAFIDAVIGLPVKKEDYYATVMQVMKRPESFEGLCCQAVKDNKDLAKQMKSAYKKLMRSDEYEEAQTVSESSLRKGKRILTPMEAAEREEIVQSRRVKTFGRKGMKYLIINGMATPTKWAVGITQLKLLIGGGKFTAWVLPSLWEILMCFVPAAGLACAVAMMFFGIVPGKDPRKRLAYFIMVCCMLCTAYSVYVLGSTAWASVVSFFEGQFTLENIAQTVAKSPFEIVEGLAGGLKDGFLGWFD